MPRRPRPASRRPPPTSQVIDSAKDSGESRKFSTVASSSKDELKQLKRVVSQGGDEGVDEAEETEDEDQRDEVEDKVEDLDADSDVPRIAQWVDEEELELESEEEEEEGVADIGALQDGLTSLPFGALRKAQHVLSQVEDRDSASDGDHSFDSELEEQSAQVRSKSLGKDKEKRSIEKRKNKHAPMEMSSKKAVPRKKVEVEDKRPIPRDPRFLPLAGEFSAQRFQSQYSFLTSIHTEELSTLKKNLKRARKLLGSSPRDQREEREAEVLRLERAVKRAESTVNRDRRDSIEQAALDRATAEEKEKRKQGKGAWYMKQAHKKELLVRAKYDALETTGGKNAVKKAIEKRQKKIHQKEKKRRPFRVESEGPGGFGGQKRPRDESVKHRVANKRQRFS